MVGICWKHSLLDSARIPFVPGCCTAWASLCLDSFLQTGRHLCSQTQAGLPRCSWCNSPGRRPGWAQQGRSWDGEGWDTPCCRAAPLWRRRSRTTGDGWSAVSTPPPGWMKRKGASYSILHGIHLLLSIQHTQRTRSTCLLASRSAVTPSSWKQSAATGVDARNLSTMFTARQQHSKDRRKCLCTGMSQLTSVQRASAVSCKKNQSISLNSRSNITPVEKGGF